MPEPTTHPSDLALDEHTAGLVTARAAAVAAHLPGCPECAARVAALQATYDQFLSEHPRAEVVPAKVITLGPRRWWRPLSGALAAAAAALLLVVWPDQPPPEDHGVRSKGGTVVEIAVGRGAESMPFTGQPLRAGDRLAFRYSTAALHLMLVSLEASGKVSVLLPAAGGQSLAITPGRELRLAEGVELDDYPGPERIVALFSATPLSTREVRSAVEQSFAGLSDAARQTLALPVLPLDAEQLSWLVTKEAR